MKPIRDLKPYMGSTDDSINASLSILKLFKRVRLFDPAYKPSSRYQARIKNRLAARKAARRAALGTRASLINIESRTV